MYNSNPELIRSNSDLETAVSWLTFFFLKLFFYFLAKLFFEFLNIWSLYLCGRLLCNSFNTRAYLSLEFVILLNFASDDAKLNITNLFVSKSFGDQFVDRVPLRLGPACRYSRAWSLSFPTFCWRQQSQLIPTRKGWQRQQERG